MNKKQILKGLIVAILISVLCASSYYYGVSSSYVGTTSEVWVNPPFSEASYVVGLYNSTYYYAKNCTTGKYDYLSTDASTVIQSALNALTSGRTWQEKVVLKGTFTITSNTPITIPSYTILDLIQAKFIFDNTVNFAWNPLLTNSNWANGNSYITILGGVIDANFPTNSNSNGGILITGTDANRCSNIIIDGVKVSKVSGGIQFEYVDKSQIINNYVEAGDDIDHNTWIQILHGNDNVIKNNVVINGVIEVSKLDTTIYSYRNNILNNLVWGNTYRGMIRIYTNAFDTIVKDNRIKASTAAIYSIQTTNLTICNNVCIGQGSPTAGDDLISLASIKGLLCEGNYVYNSNKNGINLDSTTGSSRDVQILNNYVEASQNGAGIRIISADKTAIIEGNTVKNNVNSAGIFILSGDGVIVANNIAYDDLGVHTQSKGISLENCNYSTVIGNSCTNNTDAGIEIYPTTGSCYYNEIANNVLAYNGQGIYISGNQYGNIHDNQVVSSSSYGIRLYSYDDYCWVHHNFCNGNNPDISIYNANCDNNIIYHNNLNSSTKVTDSGTGTIKRFNIGFVTENSGTSTIANNEWVSHGLAGTPTVVTITVRTATYGTPAVPVVVGWINQNSTKFQVSAYWTNGTAITNDAISISWYTEDHP